MAHAHGARISVRSNPVGEKLVLVPLIFDVRSVAEVVLLTATGMRSVRLEYAAIVVSNVARSSQKGSPMDKRVTILAGVIKKKDMRGRKVTGYKATISNLESTAKSETEAKDKLATELTKLATDLRDPLVLWSWDHAEIMITYRSVHGWHYVFHRPYAPVESSAPFAKNTRHLSRDSGGCGAYATFEECADAMKAHWYQNNVDGIVRGILGLGGYRLYSCPKCQSATQAWPIRENTYKCSNPWCNHETVEK